MSERFHSTHPSRRQLVAHLDKSDIEVLHHVEHCDDCRMTLEALARCRTIRSLKSAEGQQETLVQRLLSTPALISGPGKKLLHAAPTSDSWRAGQFAEVRNAAHGIERRLRFRAGGYSVDLVADRLGDSWEVSLRLSRRGAPVSHFMASCDGRKVLPIDIGFFAWQSHRPPRRLRVWSTGVSIQLEPIGW
jgi:hypothetical protein